MLQRFVGKRWGRTPSNQKMCRLSNGINLHAMNDSRDSAFFISSTQSLLANSANILCSSNNAVLNEPDVRIFLQPSASRPDGPDPPFVSIATFKMRDSSISSYTIG